MRLFLGMLIIFLGAYNPVLAQVSSSQDKTLAKLFGEFSLGSDYREKGITETDHGPFFMGSLGYAFPKARMGIVAHNVKFPESEESLNMRLFISYKFEILNQVYLTPRFDLNNYFKSSNRNGTIMALNLDIYSWNIYYEKQDHFEGTEATQDWIGFGRKINFASNWALDSRVGYATYDNDLFSSAFDLKLAVEYQLKDFKPSIEATYHSQPDDYNGRADLGMYAKISAKF